MAEPSAPTPFATAASRVATGADAGEEAAGLVASMTDAERLACLDGDTPFWGGIGDMTTGGYHRHPWPAARIGRLGLPGLAFADGPRGCVLDPATCFPVSMARGASFDVELERSVGEAIGAELAAAGATLTGAVCANLLRHPGWGRAQETYGEDPHHVGEMGAALTEGLQHHVLACMKHVAANSMENARFAVDVEIGERNLHEVYLAQFRRIAAAGVASAMSAYNSLNGHWCGEHPGLLTEVLRQEWGWDGVVISDFVFGLRDPVASVLAGLDVEMPFRQQRATALADALVAGEPAGLDRAVTDRATAVVAAQLRFAHLITADRPTVDHAAHQALARRAASQSMILVRNAEKCLPLDPDRLGRVAVLGRLAAVPNLGDGGSSDVHPPHAVTPLDGLRAALGDDAVVHQDTDVSVIDGADAVVVVVGFTATDEGEFLDDATTAGLSHLFPPDEHPDVGWGAPMPAGHESEGGGVGSGSTGRPDGGAADGFTSGGDRARLGLHPEDEALIAAAAARHPKVVVAVMGGSAVHAPWLDDVAAALLVWYPGMEGGHALADVLTGRAEPGGRLPFVMAADPGHLPPFDPEASTASYDGLHGQWRLDAEGHAPLRPFGYGLGYTDHRLSDAAVSIGDDGRATVTVTAADRGGRAGACVAFVFASVPYSAWARPPRRLVGFAKTIVAAGGEERLTIPLDLTQVAIRDQGHWIAEDSEVTLTVGRHAADQAAILHLDPTSVATDLRVPVRLRSRQAEQRRW